MIRVEYILYVLMILGTWRLFAGPTLYDRLISLNLMSAQVVLLFCLHAIRAERAFYLDVAMVYALLSFAETIAFARLRPCGEGSP